MKKVLFSLFFFSVMVIGAQAQKSSCAKSCTAKPGAAAATSCHSNAASTASVTPAQCTAPSSAAAKLAASDPTIESIICPDGTVCYKRKVTDASTGQAAYVSLSYDAATNTFVNVAPSTMEGASCHGKATGASGTAVKSSCTPANGKACCAGKAKSASATNTTTTEGQAVKTSGSIKN